MRDLAEAGVQFDALVRCQGDLGIKLSGILDDRVVQTARRLRADVKDLVLGTLC